MKKQLLQFAVVLTLMLQACNKPAQEVKLEKYNITLTTPKLDAPPEYTDLKVSETDTKLSDYDFNIGGRARVSFAEITESIYPGDLASLKKAATASEGFVELIEEKQLPNGVFGLIFKMKGSDQKSIIKHYAFYYKKGTRFFKIEPVFNSELNDLDKQLAAFATIK